MASDGVDVKELERISGESSHSPKSMHYHNICLKGLRKTTKNLCPNIRRSGRNLNRKPSECKSGALPLYQPVLLVHTDKS